MDEDHHPEFKVAPRSEYAERDAQGFIIVQKSDLVGLDGPVYVWPLRWPDERPYGGIFVTREEAERLLAGRLH